MNQTFLRIEKPKRKLLNPEYIPVPLVKREDREPIKILDLKHHRRVSGPVVLMRFMRFGMRIYFRNLFRRPDSRRTAVETRELFEGLQGIWIKLGQLLSLRSDFFSDDMCNELSNLLYSNIGFPNAGQVVTEQLGCPLETIFSEFEEVPLAAASIAQVHRAVLREEGVPVVIKLLRPNVIEAFRRDMVLLRWTVEILSIFMPLRRFRLRDGLNELNAMVQEELNYAYEAANSRQLRKVLRRHNVYVPYVFRKYCTEKMLVMEEISGVLMREAMEVQAAEPERFAEWCKVNSISPKKVAKNLFLSNMRQIVEDNLFHGDMHPGNIILLRNSRYALIDFGSIGSTDKTYLQTFLGMLRSVINREYERAANLALHTCADMPAYNVDEILADLVNAFKLWQARSELDTLGYHERSLNASTKITGQVFAKHHLQLNWAPLRMGRTMGTLDSSLASFYPDMNHARMFARYLGGASKRGRENRVKNLRSGVANLLESANQYRVLLEPAVQRAAITYKQKMDKISLIAALLMRFWVLVIVVLIIYTVHVFIDQHYVDLSEFPGSSLINAFPTKTKEWFVLLIIGLAMCGILLRRLIRIVSTSYLR